MSPRRARVVEAGYWFHLVNRAVNRQRIFETALDYDTLLAWLETALARHPVTCGGYCLMPNHFHLLASPHEDGALGAFMHLAIGGHAANIRTSSGTQGYGHVYQARYWSRPIATDEEYLRVLRYVEGNPLRARLVDHAEAWPWSSLWARTRGRRPALTQPPVALPPDWVALVNAGCQPDELEAIRRPVKRGRPSRSPRPADEAVATTNPAP